MWKTTPFMALLLMAGLSLVPEDLLKAAKVDGATAWQRFTRIMVPLMKPAILVALLFRTLDAFRIFDNIFILTNGQQHTGSVSMLNYDNLFTGFNLGHRVGHVGADLDLRRDHRVRLHQGLRHRRSRIESPAMRTALAKKRRWDADGSHDGTAAGRLGRPPTRSRSCWRSSRCCGSCRCRSRRRPRSPMPASSRRSGQRRTTPASFKSSEFIRPLINSIGIGLIATFIAVVLASMAAYAVARLRFPGKSVLIGMSLLIAMFPAIALVTPLFNIERILGLFDTWPGLIIPYVAIGLPLGIYTLSAFFREIPWELEKAAKVDGATPFQAFVRVIAPLAAPGMVTTAILVFLFCWNEFLLAITLTSTIRARTAPAAMAFFTGNSAFAVPTGTITAAAVVITIPIIIFVLFFQRRIVAGLTSGAVKG